MKEANRRAGTIIVTVALVLGILISASVGGLAPFDGKTLIGIFGFTVTILFIWILYSTNRSFLVAMADFFSGWW
ncbi:MAG TPA: hypothetical protein VK629_20495 [Steroidobacteraceae bacterium]|nr:hypothetical protein [Steroidobacteraceae bacterium]